MGVYIGHDASAFGVLGSVSIARLSRNRPVACAARPIAPSPDVRAILLPPSGGPRSRGLNQLYQEDSYKRPSSVWRELLHLIIAAALVLVMSSRKASASTCQASTYDWLTHTLVALGLGALWSRNSGANK